MLLTDVMTCYDCLFIYTCLLSIDTVTLTIFGESVMWRRRYYLFAVVESTGVII
jgi:hypothetical protein